MEVVIAVYIAVAVIAFFGCVHEYNAGESFAMGLLWPIFFLIFVLKGIFKAFGIAFKEW